MTWGIAIGMGVAILCPPLGVVLAIFCVVYLTAVDGW